MERPSFVNLPKPFIVCVVTDPNPNAALATICNAECDGAQAFDLHLRTLEKQYHNEEDLTRIIMSSYRPMMTIYYREENPRCIRATDEERAEAHLMCVRCGVSACDIMADYFDPNPNQLTMKQEAIDKQRRLIDSIHRAGAEVVLSSHNWREMSCDEVVSHMREMEKRGADMVKIACVANSEEQLLESMKTTVALKHELKVPFIHIVMGQYGKLHRFVGPMLGSSLVFCVESYTEFGHKEQPLVRSAKAVFENLDWHVARNPLSITR